MISRSIVASAGLLIASAVLASVVDARTIPAPLYGVTLDDVSGVNRAVTALHAMAKVPTVRIVFDKGEPASYYASPARQLNPVAYIMGELVDSSYMKRYSLAAVQSFTTSYVNTLGSLVDVWEIGNEVNGNWLSRQGNGADVMPKIEAMYDIVSAHGAPTALTFFYEGEPSEPHNCIATGRGGNDMFTWINQRFVTEQSAETEKIRLGLNYAMISWYPDQCPGEMPNWAMVFTELAAFFPNAQVGFGELGTANPQYGSSFELNEISSIYPMMAGVGGLPENYIGGVFWWYWAEEGIPQGTAIWNAINNAIQQ
jgi:phosphoribosylcarboxyaminoimidazole (NCAIR) mutase